MILSTNLQKKLPKNSFLFSEDMYLIQMHSSVSINQHHLHEFPSLYQFSMHLQPLLPGVDIK
jgi:hypothetical protein